MIKTYRYKQNIYPKIAVLFIFIIIALYSGAYQYSYGAEKLHFSYGFPAIFIILQLLIYLYYNSKSVEITYKGIELKILWGTTYRSVSWRDIEEASFLPKAVRDKHGNINWMDKSDEETVKIIVSNDDALYLQMGSIKNSSALCEILQANINFIKY